MKALKVYGWRWYRSRDEFDREFPGEGGRHLQSREIVAASSKAEVGRIVGRDPRVLDLGETGNAEELEVALAEPGVVFWKPLDHRSGRWVR